MCLNWLHGFHYWDQLFFVILWNLVGTLYGLFHQGLNLLLLSAPFPATFVTATVPFPVLFGRPLHPSMRHTYKLKIGIDSLLSFSSLMLQLLELPGNFSYFKFLFLLHPLCFYPFFIVKSSYLLCYA